MTWEVRPNPRKLVRYGQEPETGDLIFPVRVRGLPAMSASPKEVAELLCRNWTASARSEFPLGLVHVEVAEPDRE